MQIDTLALRLRPRTQMEAADLGARLCQSAAGSTFSCYAIAAVPVVLLTLASSEVAAWLPVVAIWWAKPWLDRTILFVLARAAFGQRTTPADLMRELRDVWWTRLVFTMTVLRFSPWRSFTAPVYQLEGLSIRAGSRRAHQIRRRNIGSAAMTTCAFSLCELALTTSLLSLLFWFAPPGRTPELGDPFFGDTPGILALALPIAYGLAVAYLEPFYVAAGFAMYLNRRAELEAWDIEQEFRRAFAQ